MDNEKNLKRTALDYDEIEAVSGGSWASDEEKDKAFDYVKRVVTQMISITDGERAEKAASIFQSMKNDPDNTYTANDFITRVREELHL